LTSSLDQSSIETLVWPLFLIRPRSYSPRTFGAEGVVHYWWAQQDIREQGPSPQPPAKGAKHMRQAPQWLCRRLSNAPRITKAVVLEGTNRVDDRPYEHRVDVECAAPTACHEADICVKACNGSDGRARRSKRRVGGFEAATAVSFTLAAPFAADVAARPPKSHNRSDGVIQLLSEYFRFWHQA
jgi:hypothetical protein